MSLKSIFVLGAFLFVIGAFSGFFVLHFPFIELDTEVKLFDIVNFILALSLGLWVPFVIKKAIDDNREIKAYIAEDLKILISNLSRVTETISNAYEVGSFSIKDRDSIIHAFHFLELEVSCIEDQMKISFPKKTDELTMKLKNLLLDYQDYLTGGELMLSSFTIVDDRFYKEHGTEFSKIKTGIKTLIHEIYKL